MEVEEERVLEGEEERGKVERGLDRGVVEERAVEEEGDMGVGLAMREERGPELARVGVPDWGKEPEMEVARVGDKEVEVDLVGGAEQGDLEGQEVDQEEDKEVDKVEAEREDKMEGADLGEQEEDKVEGEGLAADRVAAGVQEEVRERKLKALCHIILNAIVIKKYNSISYIKVKRYRL